MNNSTNYETQNAAFHIGDNRFVFNTARACVIYCDDTETPWTKFVRCMTHGHIGKMLVETPEGIRWDSPAIDVTVMNNLLLNL